MRWFAGHRIIKDGEDYIVLLYLDKHLTEFAREFSEAYVQENKNFQERVADYIKEKLPKLRVNKVKVMLGSLPIASLSLEK